MPKIMTRALHILLSLFFLLIVCYVVSPSLNPFHSAMFDMHDMTQVGRIESFVLSLRSGQIPPRLAPEYSYNLGFPVFNFYAPTAYWITSFMMLLGASSVVALKLSFLLTVLLAYASMWYLLSRWFSQTSSIVGALTYVTSTYFATEIMIRGNLAESWFLALFPLGIGLLVEQSLAPRRVIRLCTPIVLALLFMTHNMLGLFAILISVGFACCLAEKKRNAIAIGLALCLSAVFFIPAFAEGSLVQASTVAKEYSYAEHFLCPWQIWTAKDWGFGGSLPGCDADSMSFKLGKIQLILAVFGIFLFGLGLTRRKKQESSVLALCWVAVWMIGALFLTLEISKPLWDLFSPVMALFQFPWRFLVFGMFGVAVFAGYFFQSIPGVFRGILFLPIVLLLVIPARKYFIKPAINYEEYEQKYASTDYRQRYLAYNMREYIARDVDYAYWNTLNPATHPDVMPPFEYTQPIETSQAYVVRKDTLFEKEVVVSGQGEVRLNIHAFPYWKIQINGNTFSPTHVDRLARPIVSVKPLDVISIRYEQTEIEKFADFLAVFALLLIGFGAGDGRSRNQVGNDIH